MRLPVRHVVQPQRAVGLIQVHLQPGRARRQRCGRFDVVRAGAQVLAVIAARFAPRGGQRQFERRRVSHRRLRVGHRQHGREPAGQRRGRAAVPILLVRAARLAQVDVYVDQSRESHLHFLLVA